MFGLLDTPVHSNEKRYNYGRTHENHMRAHDEGTQQPPQEEEHPCDGELVLCKRKC